MAALISRCLCRGGRFHKGVKQTYLRLGTASFSYMTKKINFCTSNEQLLLLIRQSRKRPTEAFLLSSLRCNSTISQANSVAESVQNTTDYIPAPPAFPTLDPTLATDQVVETLNALGEPTLQSLGLCSYWPSGWIQQGLEYLHVSCGLPWWGSIVAGTLVLRLMIFPLMIKQRRSMAALSEHLPMMQKLQETSEQYMNMGNKLEGYKYMNELALYSSKHNVKPNRSMLLAFIQAPIFVSVFSGIRGMCKLPVESLEEGGIWFFTDLTAAQPFYTLPLVTCFTLFLTLETGSDGLNTHTTSPVVKWVLRGLPVVMLPIISNFSSALLVYWFTSNSFSLVQVLFLKIPAVSNFFKLPVAKKVEAKDVKVKRKKSVKEVLDGAKETFSTVRGKQKTKDRLRADQKNFNKAAVGPIVKTYKHNPKLKQIRQ